MNSDLTILEFSDVHLGHPETPTSLILRNLRKITPDTSELSKVDMIIIAGDLFDRLLNLPDSSVDPIRAWMKFVLELCVKHDIVLRILEGTPSHDWRQSKIFINVNEENEIGADCKYYDELAIEYIERFDINVLYVPDEWRPDPNQTWGEVQALMKKYGLKKVDFAIMHGFFPHQLPTHLVPGAHDHARYLGIVKYLIFIGHVHQYSQYERILSAGSTDRLNHSEEEPKGWLRAVVKKTGEYKVTFMENKGAKIYKTVETKELDGEELFQHVHEQIKDLPDGSSVRIHCRKGEPASAALKYFQTKYGQFSWKMKLKDEKIKGTDDLKLLKREFKTVKVTKANIVQLLMERIRSKYPSYADDCERVLKEVIDDNARST